ncbi:MAG: hypothetical protein H7144_17315 [Burkholderiales bacterium]|nr:hypothetical protein [Phycisphaerae bacterium]
MWNRTTILILALASVSLADLAPFSSPESRELDARMKVRNAMWDKVFALRNKPDRVNATREELELLEKIEAYEAELKPLADAAEMQRFKYYRKQHVESFVKNASIESEEMTVRQFQLAPEKLEFKIIKLKGWSFIDVHGETSKLPSHIVDPIAGAIPTLSPAQKDFGSIDAVDNAGHELKGIVFYKPELLDTLVKLKPGQTIDMIGFTFKDVDSSKRRFMIVTITPPADRSENVPAASTSQPSR